MRCLILRALSIVLTLACATSARAQGGELDGVTMHVQEDVSELDAVVIELGGPDGNAPDSVDGDGAKEDDSRAPAATAPEDPEPAAAAGEPAAAAE